MMPLYDFKCPKCGAVYADRHFKLDDEHTVHCFYCGSQCVKALTPVAFHLKSGGVGWARDGYSGGVK